MSYGKTMKGESEKVKMKFLIGHITKFNFISQDVILDFYGDKNYYNLKIEYYSDQDGEEHSLKIRINQYNPYIKELFNLTQPFDISSSDYITKKVRKVIKWQYELLALDNL